MTLIKKQHQLLARIATETLILSWWEYKKVQPRWKTVWWFLIQVLKRPQQFHFLSLYPKGMKTNFHRKTCSRMFIPVLFMIVKNLKHYICPLLKLSFGIFVYSLILLSDQTKCTIDRLNERNELQKYLFQKCIMCDSMWSSKIDKSNVYSKRQWWKQSSECPQVRGQPLSTRMSYFYRVYFWIFT